MPKQRLFRALALSTVSFVACAKQGTRSEPESAAPSAYEPAAAPSETAAGSEAATDGPSAINMPAGEMGSPGLSKPAAPVGATLPPLTDAQILKVVAAVDDGEIDQGKEVQKKAKSTQVKKLAAQLVQHHSRSKQKGAALAKKAQLTAEDSPVASELTGKAEDNLQAIRSASAADEAERAYVDAQVSQHESVLQLIDNRLLPSAVNADLKAQLEETRTMVQGHIEASRNVQQALAEKASSVSAN